ncbi:MAG: hypothetical protein BWY04_01175 [candidate division CPR1 bacterium ADurb.Bin160]|uniref:Uncharacterized protein n=1 Tax=candidate division CPR1 bacterium ADurb.Bin160 TaxID=1852826 RepID=A0A1V5ZLC2_9BACT|nr:MAG: hypothetical protein BWY04_01175 [candidate division CPR1 bacterium ADurb.Bin160]
MADFVNASDTVIQKHWIGLISNLDNQIESTYSYNIAEQAGFHHNLYMKQSDLEKLNEGVSSLFFINKDDKTINGWRLDNDERISPDQISNIKKFYDVKAIVESQITNKVASVNIHKKPGLDREKFIKDYGQIVFKKGTLSENEPMKDIFIVFPGRFQPFNKSHQDVINMIYGIFGSLNVYLLVSEYHNPKTDPLTYIEKKILILKSNLTLNAKHIKPKKHMLFDEVTLSTDLGIQNRMNTSIVICIFSQKDSKMIEMKDKETYFQPWPQELYNCSREELYKLTKHIPSMDKYGFAIFTDLIPSEISFIAPEPKGLPFYLGMFELQKQILDPENYDDIQKKLPYDIKELLKYKSEIGQQQFNDYEESKKIVNEEKIGSYMFDMNPLHRYTLYKNPQTCKKMMSYIRGIMLPNGDLYVVDYNLEHGYVIHRHIANILNQRVGLSLWKNKNQLVKQYKDFFAVVGNKDNSEFELSESYHCTNMKKSEYKVFKAVINRYVEIFREKHPQFRFKDVDWIKFDAQAKIK